MANTKCPQTAPYRTVFSLKILPLQNHTLFLSPDTYSLGMLCMRTSQTPEFLSPQLLSKNKDSDNRSERKPGGP